METIIRLEGMKCGHCKAKVEAACKSVSGVTDAVGNIEEKLVVVTGDADRNAVRKAITEAGYKVEE